MEHGCNDGARHHFAVRVAERIGPNVDGLRLWDEVRRALLAGDETFARFRCNLKNKGRAAYKIMVGDQLWFIVADKAASVPITVMPREDPIYADDFCPRRRRGLPVRQRDRKPGPLWIRGRRVK